MSLLIEVTLVCDGCGVAFLPANPSKGYVQRKAAADKDWIYTADFDYCPYCRPVTKKGDYHATRNQKRQQIIKQQNK